MKKIFILLVTVFLSVAAISQERAIGVRVGAGAEASYLHPLNDANRMEFDLGLWSHGLDINVLYEWTFDLEENFSWYVGAGGTLGLHHDDGAIGVVGNIGLEYNFEEIPLQLTLDYRPAIYFVPNSGFWGDGVGLGVRYRF